MPCVFQLFMGLPELKFLLQAPAAMLTLKRMITMLKPIFSGEGTNALIFEKEVYGYFVKYLRETAGLIVILNNKNFDPFLYPTKQNCFRGYTGMSLFVLTLCLSDCPSMCLSVYK